MNILWLETRMIFRRAVDGALAQGQREHSLLGHGLEV